MSQQKKLCIDTARTQVLSSQLSFFLESYTGIAWDTNVKEHTQGHPAGERKGRISLKLGQGLINQMNFSTYYIVPLTNIGFHKCYRLSEGW